MRILKELRSELDDAGHPAAQSIPGYVLECLTWNAPDTFFDRYGWYARVGAVLGYLGTQIDSGSSWQTWREVDKVKLLFAQSQPWTPVQARAFINAAWAYLGAR